MAPVRRVRLANGTPIYTTRFKWLQVANLGQTSGVRPTPHENHPCRLGRAVATPHPQGLPMFFLHLHTDRRQVATELSE